MKRTIVATSFVLMAGLIGAAVTFVLLRGAPRAEAPQRAPDATSPVSTVGPPSHINAQYRVAIRFPDRFEFDRGCHRV